MTPIVKCFWCDRAQFGSETGGEEGREISYMGYGFCDACERVSAGKIVCIAVDTPERAGHPAFSAEPPFDALAPTGRWALLEVKLVGELGFPLAALEAIKSAKRAFIDRAAFEQYFGGEG